MRKILFLAFLFFCLAGSSQTLSPEKIKGNPELSPAFRHAQSLYDWRKIEDELSSRLQITNFDAYSFFMFAFQKGYLSMNEYMKLVKEGSVTEKNALQYWMDQMPVFEKLYREKYLPNKKTIETERQGNNTVYTGGANCNNLDFSTGNSNGWKGQWNSTGGNSTGTSSTYGTLNTNGFNSSGYNTWGYVHELCTGGLDRNVPIQTVPPGHSYAMRLGNDSAYQILVSTQNQPIGLPFNHQMASNTFYVNQSDKSVTYWYAVVLCQYNPNNHTATDQPFFRIRLYDASNQEIMCAHYDVDAFTAPNIGGFQTQSTQIYDSNTGTFQPYDFLYKDWSQVMVPLSNYAGQNVTLTFESSDCAHGGHPGYAYVVADCAPLSGITFPPFSCGNSTTVLTGPPGVATYSWTGPGIVGSATNQTVTVNTGGTYTLTMTTLGNSGVNCTVKIDTTIGNAPPLPVANFTTAPVCVGNPTAFANQSSGGPFNHQSWNFGDGSTDTTKSPTHTYAAAGTYTVSLVVNNGCLDTFTTTVTVNPGANPAFTAPPVCQGSTTIFTNSTTGATSYSWNFGDGSAPSTVQNPTHTYASAGTFTATLTATTSFGCQFVLTHSVLVNPMPTASFSAPPTCFGLPTNFTNTSAGGTGLTYSWDFGDGSSLSSAQNPSHTYASIGTYTVSLQVTTSAGCSASVAQSITVNPVPSLSLSSPSLFCWNDLVPAPLYTVNPNNGSVSYSWTNSTTQIGLPGNGNGIPPSFTAGMNNTTSNISGIITVTPSLNGCTGAPASYTITVKPTPFISHPTADFCPDMSVGPITLTASPAGSTMTWSNTTAGVNIGMSATNGTTTIPVFTTIDPGLNMATNVISVQAFLNGCSGPVSTFSINVNPNPVASFSNSVACDGAATSFYDQSTIGSGTIVQWDWDMDNNGTYNDATIQNPSYVLTPVGNHTVDLAVTSNKGCTDTVAEAVYVNPRPTVTFSGDSLSGCNPVKTIFTDSCSVAAPDYITTWYWDLGNGTTLIDTSGTAVSTTYTNGANTYNVSYNVSLTAISEVGCASKLTKTSYVTVYPIPKALFWWDPGDASVLAPGIQFHDQSLGATTWLWNFGDVFNSSNNSSTVANPYHEYSDQQPYTYYVTQYVTNNYGCKDSVREPVIIKPEVTFYVPNAFTPNYNGLNDGFKGTGIGIDNSTYNMWIFDRWGNEVFHSTDLDTAWDGRRQGKGDICQEDTYVWKVYFRDIEAKEYSYKGVVHLLK